MHDSVTGSVLATEEQLDELSVQLQTYNNMALFYHEGEMGARAIEAWKYYYGELPVPVTKSSSKWTDRSVWEAVNGSLQELVSVFTSGENAVRFQPRSTADAIGAEAATEMVNKVLLSDNDGYRALHDTFKEACIIRNSWIKRYWKEGYETVTETFVDLNETEVALLLNKVEKEEDLISMNIEEDVDTKLSKGDMTYRVYKEGVVVEYVPFEQVIVEPSAISIEDANYIAHRVRKSKDELLEMGFDPEVVENLPINTTMLTEGVITNERFDNLLPINVSDNYNIGDDKTDRVWLYENYIRTSCISGEMELLQVFTVNNQILEINRVNEIPLETLTPFPIPGAIFGESITDIVKDIQDLNSFLIRGMIENIMNANHQRYMGVKGQYDKRSLLDNRPGGVVEISSLNAVTPFPYHALPNGINFLVEYVEQKKEARTGVTRLGQGLDPNVFKNDNAFATVNTLMTASQNKLRMIARNIAEGGMKKLMLSIYRLIKENAKEPIQVETSKGVVTINPSQLPERDKMIVSVAVGASERRERSQTLTALLQVFQNTPSISQYMQPQNAYYLGTQLLESMGIYDVQNYMTPPDQLPPPKPNPMQEMEMQTVAENIKNIQAQTQKVLSEIEEAQQKIHFEQVKTADDFTMRREESLSKQDEAADKMSLEERKLILQEREIALKERELELKRQEILIEAQLEHQQGRSVGLGRS